MSFKLLVKLHEIFNMLKDFNSMYSSNSSNKMVVQYKDDFYLLQFNSV